MGTSGGDNSCFLLTKNEDQRMGFCAKAQSKPVYTIR